MPKGQYLAEFEQYVMLALVRLRDNAYGVTIRQEIESRTGREVSIGAVYATLGRLADKSMVESWSSAPTPVRGGRSRRHFRVTEDGAAALRHTMVMLGRMATGLQLGIETRGDE